MLQYLHHGKLSLHKAYTFMTFPTTLIKIGKCMSQFWSKIIFSDAMSFNLLILRVQLCMLNSVVKKTLFN